MHAKKLIAPIALTIVMVAYFLVYALVLWRMLPPLLRLLFGLIPLGLAAGSVYVLIERIQEIRSGEEDDLSQY